SFTHIVPTYIYTLSLHDALPICALPSSGLAAWVLVSLIEIFSRSTNPRKTDREIDSSRGIQSQINRCYSGVGFQTLLVWSAETGRFTFLTESLILAQNERWRRG